MILDHLYNLTDIIDNYYVGDKKFDEYLDKNKIELNKLKLKILNRSNKANKSNRFTKLNKLVGAGKELQNAVNELDKGIHGLKDDIETKTVDYSQLGKDDKTAEAIQIAQLLTQFLRELYGLTKDEKLKEMEKQIQDMIDILNKY